MTRTAKPESTVACGASWLRRIASSLILALGVALAVAPISSTVAAAATLTTGTSPLDLATVIGPIASPDKLRASQQNVISVGDATCKEGTTCRFTVTLTNGQPGVTNTFNIKTVDGTAKSDLTVPRAQADYHFSASGGVFAPGASSGSVTFFVETFTDNLFLEPDEAFHAQIYEVGFQNIPGSGHPPTQGRTTGTGIIPGIDLTLNR